MEIESIRRKQKKLRKDIPERKILSVSDISSYFLPNTAKGSYQDKKRGSSKHRRIEKKIKSVNETRRWEIIKDEGGFPEWFIRSTSSLERKIVLSGKIDMIYFRDSFPELVIERKFPRETNLKTVYKNERFQAWLYSYMLENIGFETEKLDYAVLKMPETSTLKEAREVDKTLFELSKQGTLHEKSGNISDAPFTLFTSNYSSEDYEDQLNKIIKEKLKDWKG